MSETSSSTTTVDPVVPAGEGTEKSTEATVTNPPAADPAEAKEREKEELRDSVRLACEDYARMITTETSGPAGGPAGVGYAPSQSIASIEKVLARIDEFALFIENMEDEAKSMTELSAQLSAQTKNIKEVFAMIDALALYIRQASGTVTALEDRATAAEKFFGTHARKTFLKSIPLFRKNIAAEPVMDNWVSVTIPQTTNVINSIPGKSAETSEGDKSN